MWTPEGIHGPYSFDFLYSEGIGFADDEKEEEEEEEEEETEDEENEPLSVAGK